MEKQSKNNTLYLPIKQVYFDQIIDGTKKIEYREVKEGITAGRYLFKDASGKFVRNPEVAKDPDREYYIDDIIDGRFPFLPKPYKYLSLAVGYAKERDTAVVEVTDITFHPEMIREDRDGKPCFAFWIIEYHKLVSALFHSHPFARFKAVIDSCPYRQEWFAYKQKCLEAYVRDEISENL